MVRTNIHEIQQGDILFIRNKCKFPVFFDNIRYDPRSFVPYAYFFCYKNKITYSMRANYDYTLYYTRDILIEKIKNGGRRKY